MYSEARLRQLFWCEQDFKCNIWQIQSLERALGKKMKHARPETYTYTVLDVRILLVSNLLKKI